MIMLIIVVLCFCTLRINFALTGMADWQELFFSSQDGCDRIKTLSKFNSDSTMIASQFNETSALRTNAVRVREVKMTTQNM